jgi:tetratricopeptide (TPR) repeat protein
VDEYSQRIKDFAAGINTLPAIQAELEKNPDDVEVNFKMAEKYIDRWEREKSKPYFEKVLELDPDDKTGHKTEATYQVAILEVNTDKNPEPLKAFIAAGPDEKYMEDSFMTLAFHYLRTKDPENAVKTYEEALDKMPENARMMFYYASAIFNNKMEGLYEKGLKLNEQAITLDPELEDNAVYNLVSYYRNLGDTDKIIETFENAIQKWPDNNGLKSSYASTINSMKIESKYDYGIELMEKTIEENPDAVYMSYTLGLLYHKVGELEKAITEIKKVVEKYPTRKVYQKTLEKIQKELEEKI